MFLPLISVMAGNAPGGGGGGDVSGFLAATGIGDGTIISALNTLDSAFTSAGLWAKLVAVYPFVGGTSTTNSYNLKNSAAYQITWTGGLTHDANGVTGDGVNSGTTGIVPSTDLDFNDMHVSVYSRTNVNQNYCDIGCSSTGAGKIGVYPRDFFEFFGWIGALGTAPAYASANSLGHYLVSRTSSTDNRIYENGTLRGTAAGSNVTSAPTNAIRILSNITTTPVEVSARNLAFATVGAGLNGTEAAALAAAIEAFQDALSRGVV